MRFLVDGMCGGLVSYLRMCGYDTRYAGDEGLEADDEVLAVAKREHRTIVTRDAELAQRSAACVLLESHALEGQLRGLREAGVELELPTVPIRCGRCNGVLEEVRRTTSTPEYAPDPGEKAVWQCRDCGQCFWRGSHWDRVGKMLRGI